MISIIDKPKLDIKKLNEEITLYVNLNGHNPKYLIMSNETMRELSKSFHPFICSIPILPGDDDNCIRTYKGIDVSICNRIYYGEVDIV